MKEKFPSLLAGISTGFTPVLDTRFSPLDYFPLNLSETNKELETVDISSSAAMDAYIGKILKTYNAKVAWGGYLESRGIYRRSRHFNLQDPETERNIHLGMDLWAPAGTKVLAALDGEIHSFADNGNFGDYGPTIILKHTLNGTEFYSLYGHLSRESLVNLRIGKKVKQGEEIGTLGTAEVNGDYAPHLHFQIIIDLEGCFGDYPGVTSKKDLAHFTGNCPNPNLLLKIS